MENRSKDLGSKRKRKITVKEKIKKILIDHTIILVLVVLTVLISVPYALLGIMWLLDKNMCPGSFTRLEDGINVWFTFWGSYAGAITSVFLSICTIRLSVKYERINEKNAMIQQAISFHQFRIEKVLLFDLENSFPADIIPKFEDTGRGNYIIEVQFEDSFPPYFKVKAKEVEWRNAKGCFSYLEGFDYVIENNNNFSIYLLLKFESDLKTDIDLFSIIDCFGSDSMSLEEKTRCLRMRLVCENLMDFDRSGKDDICIGLDIELKKGDRKDNNDGIYLNVLNRTIKCSRAEGEEDDKSIHE